MLTLLAPVRYIDSDPSENVIVGLYAKTAAGREARDPHLN